MTTDMDRHFTMGALVRYTLPSICMVIFMSVYGVVDGLFVSNFAGTTAFAAVNLIMPFIMILATCGSMIGTGGSALVGKTRGEGDDARANALFSESSSRPPPSAPRSPSWAPSSCRRWPKPSARRATCSTWPWHTAASA